MFDDPREIKFGDFNGDGILDPVVVTQDTHSYGFSPFLTTINPSTGSVTFTRLNYDLGNGLASSGNNIKLSTLAVGDFDNDGDDDVIVASYTHSTVYWIENRLNTPSEDFGELVLITSLSGLNSNPTDLVAFDSDID